MVGEVFEYAARNADGVLQIRSTGEADPLYPAEQWPMIRLLAPSCSAAG